MPKVMINRKSYELPKYTLDLADAIAEISATKEQRAIYSLQLEFLERVLPEEVVHVALDGETVSNVDLMQLNAIYNKVVAEFMRPQMEQMERQITETLKPFKQLQPLVDLVNSDVFNGA